jgi:uncharacterized membrane protein
VNYLPFVSAELSDEAPRGARGQRAALWFVIAWFFLGGLAHFAFTELEASIVPPQIPDAQIPDAVDVVLVTGVLELAGALGLMLPWTRRVAGWCLFVLTLAVTPANVYMLRAHDQFPAIPVWLLWLRLPLQVVLLWLIVWGSRWRKAARRHYL